ncbi:hypothetical protein KCU61_g554, partial [Aureobasidium melanogenum]
MIASRIDSTPRADGGSLAGIERFVSGVSTKEVNGISCIGTKIEDIPRSPGSHAEILHHGRSQALIRDRDLAEL